MFVKKINEYLSNLSLGNHFILAEMIEEVLENSFLVSRVE